MVEAVMGGGGGGWGGRTDGQGGGHGVQESGGGAAGWRRGEVEVWGCKSQAFKLPGLLLLPTVTRLVLPASAVQDALVSAVQDT
eukprot:5457588-Prymnesium_polylepis.1